jgi:hypothetical protein
MAPQDFGDITESQQKAARRRAEIPAKARANNLAKIRRLPGGGAVDPICGAITWLAEAEAQITRQQAFAARIFNEDKYIARQARLVFTQSLCCITEEIIRRSCDRIARISDRTIDDETAGGKS